MERKSHKKVFHVKLLMNEVFHDFLILFPYLLTSCAHKITGVIRIKYLGDCNIFFK